MQIIVTGSPGTGKSKLAKFLAKKYKLKLINDKEFAEKHNCGKKDKTGLLEVDLKKFTMCVRKLTGDLVFEGHLFCEIKLKADLVVVLRTDGKILEKRLKKRKYSDVKVLDNVFVEETGYCLKNAKKKYKNVVELENNKAFKDLENNIIKVIGNV